MKAHFKFSLSPIFDDKYIVTIDDIKKGKEIFSIDVDFGHSSYIYINSDVDNPCYYDIVDVKHRKKITNLKNITHRKINRFVCKAITR